MTLALTLIAAVLAVGTLALLAGLVMARESRRWR
jgi:hypothetical protein